MTLADSEIEYIEGILGREMNELEEGMLDVMFSEHCSYKSTAHGHAPWAFSVPQFRSLQFFVWRGRHG